MNESEQARLLDEGVEVWNRWRREHPDVKAVLADVDLSGRDLRGCDFRDAHIVRTMMTGVDLRDADFEGSWVKDTILNEAKMDGANLRRTSFYGSRLIDVDLSRCAFGGTSFLSAMLWGANLSRCDLRTANFSEARLDGANLSFSDLSGATLDRARLDDAALCGTSLRGASLVSASLNRANLLDADLSGADLTGAFLVGAILQSADLTGASLQAAVLVSADLREATLSGSRIFGISAWNVAADGARQDNLVITADDDPVITCDDIEVAQFIFLLLKNEKLRQIIDVVTSKTVLILGRFSDARKPVLDAVREELRGRNYTPIMFDFDKPMSKDVTGTVETLARMARFIIADLTDPSSIPHEMATIVPFLRTTPVLPVRQQGSGGYSMFDDFSRAYPWVLETHEYADSAALVAQLPEVIGPAERMAEQLRARV